MQLLRAIKQITRRAKHGDAGLWGVIMGVCLLLLIIVYVLLQPVEVIWSSGVWGAFLAADSQAPGGRSAIQKTSVKDGGNRTNLFNSDTEPVTEGSLFDKWYRVEVDIAKELDVLAQCKAGGRCPNSAQKLIAPSQEGASRTGRARIGLLNRAIDIAISPRYDEFQWGVPDLWSAPFETLNSMAGDCEDFAILKYTALLIAGPGKDSAKIIVWRSQLSAEDHAIVAV
jgi:predicted transglutaminase-like cysteine proteinase